MFLYAAMQHNELVLITLQ